MIVQRGGAIHPFFLDGKELQVLLLITGQASSHNNPIKCYTSGMPGMHLAPRLGERRLETTSKHLEASAEIDVPPRLWVDFSSAAASITERLIPDMSVALRVMDDAAIRQLNNRFRGVDNSTDVLSFPSELDDPSGHAGDIALSWETVVRQALANGNSVLTESVALFAHGMLHIIGLDHPTESAQDVFDTRTRKLCKSVGIEVETFGH